MVVVAGEIATKFLVVQGDPAVVEAGVLPRLPLMPLLPAWETGQFVGQAVRVARTIIAVLPAGSPLSMGRRNLSVGAVAALTLAAVRKWDSGAVTVVGARARTALKINSRADMVRRKTEAAVTQAVAVEAVVPIRRGEMGFLELTIP